MTINQAADFITNTLKQPFNHELKERVKDSIRNKGAAYLFQRSRQGESTEGLALDFTLEVIPFNQDDACLPATDCSWSITTNAINDYVSLAIGAPFHNVYTSNGIPLTFTTRSQYLHTRFLKTSKGQLFYILENKKLLFPNAKFIDRIHVKTIVLDPSSIISLCSAECYTDDMLLPLPTHVLDYILNAIITEQLNFTKGIIPDKEVEINEK